MFSFLTFSIRKFWVAQRSKPSLHAECGKYRVSEKPNESFPEVCLVWKRCDASRKRRSGAKLARLEAGSPSRSQQARKHVGLSSLIT